jgi:hypothetical protein
MQLFNEVQGLWRLIGLNHAQKFVSARQAEQPPAGRGVFRAF